MKVLNFIKSKRRPSIIRYFIYVISILLVLITATDLFVVRDTYQDRRAFYEQAFETRANELTLSLRLQIDNSMAALLDIGYNGPIQRHLFNYTSGHMLSDYLQNKLNMAKEQIGCCDGLFLYAQKSQALIHSPEAASDEFVELFKTMKNFYSLDEKRNFTNFVSDIYYSKNDRHARVFYVMSINSVLSDPNNKEQLIGAVLIDLTRWLDEHLADHNEMEKLIVFRNNIYVGSQQNFYPGPSPAFSNIPVGSSIVKNGKNSYMAFRSESTPSSGLGIIYFNEESQLLQQTIHAMLPVFTGQLLLMAAFLVLIFILLHFYHSTINGFASEMNRVTLGQPICNTAHPFIYEELHEFPIVINDMLSRLEMEQKEKIESQKRLYDTIIAQKQAELIAYRNQINPHFLINTLTFIQNSALLRNDNDSVLLIDSLSNMFRYALYSPYIVDLDTEIDHLKSYFSIINTRFPGKYKFQIQVTEEASEWLVLSMMLQPLLENSIKHGSNKLHAQLSITLNAYTTDDLLYIHFRDNGIGIPTEKLEKLTRGISDPETSSGQKTSITLKNIYHRIRLLYGSAATISIHSEEGEYTEILLTLPMPDDAAVDKLHQVYR